MGDISKGGNMTPAEMEKKLRDQSVPWDDIRERRVLAQIMSAKQAPKRGNGRFVAIAAAVAIGLGAALFVGLKIGGLDDSLTIIETSPLAADSGSVLSFAKAGRAVLYNGAEVKVVKQDSTELRLLQSDGKVKYEIEHLNGRETKIHAGDVIVRVVGTRFLVEVNDKKVRVEVEEGIVEVNDSRQTVSLRAGEEVSVVRATHEIEDDKVELEEDLEEDLEELLENEESLIETSPESPKRSTSQPVVEQDTSAEEESVEKDGTRFLELIDAARRDGRKDEAAALLEEFIGKHPFDPRSTAAYFTLGNVKRSLGNHEAAAEAYRKCWQKMPTGSLAEDARAAEAESLSRAGQNDMAKKAAEEYLLLFPEGIHRARMERLIK